MANRDEPPAVQSIDPIVWAREVRSLQQELLSPAFTQVTFDTWLTASIDRPSVFEDTFWGIIQWRKSLGRASGAALADGFSFFLRFKRIDAVATPGAIEVTTTWVDLPSPNAWDLPDTADSYRVGYSGRYMRNSLYVGGNLLDVTIAGRWTLPSEITGPGFLLPDPRGYMFGGDGHAIVLDPITIVHHRRQPVPVWSVKA